MTPSFITKKTCSVCRIFSTGSPGTAATSASLSASQRPDFVRQAEQIRVRGSSCSQCVDRLHAQIHHLEKLFRVASVRIHGGIRSHTDLDALRQRFLKRLMHGRNRGFRLGQNWRRNIGSFVDLLLDAM